MILAVYDFPQRHLPITFYNGNDVCFLWCSKRSLMYYCDAH